VSLASDKGDGVVECRREESDDARDCDEGEDEGHVSTGLGAFSISTECLTRSTAAKNRKN